MLGLGKAKTEMIYLGHGKYEKQIKTEKGQYVKTGEIGHNISFLQYDPADPDGARPTVRTWSAKAEELPADIDKYKFGDLCTVITAVERFGEKDVLKVCGISGLYAAGAYHDFKGADFWKLEEKANAAIKK